MKNALKDWITNIFAIILWSVSSTLFFMDKLDFWPKYLGCIIIGSVLLFLNIKTMRELAIKYINKLINK